MVQKLSGIFGRGLVKKYEREGYFIIRVIDWTIVTMTCYWAYWYRFGSAMLPDLYQLALFISLAASVMVFANLGIYQSRQWVSLGVGVRRLGVGWIIIAVMMVILAYATKTGDTFSRIWFLLWMISAGLGMVLLRFLLYNLLNWLRRRGYNIRSIIIASSGGFGSEVVIGISSAPWIGFTLSGIFVDIREPSLKCLHGVPILGQIEELIEYLQGHEVDEVWLAMPLSDEERIRRLLESLGSTMVDIRLVPDPFGQRLLQHSLTDVAGLPVLNLSVSPIQGMGRLIKALEDRILAFIILFLILPLLLGIAIAIKLDSPGPVLFRQKRHGWNCQPIEVWKFRTMFVDTEQSHYRQATRNDRRVTRLGAFLRRTSFDELPQLFNVLQGRMSIVGPRPHPIQMGDIYQDQVYGYMRRHKIKPGITGWAQVNGFRGETDALWKMQLRIEFDLYYIENWSLLFDLRILLLTILKGFRHPNAY